MAILIVIIDMPVTDRTYICGEQTHQESPEMPDVQNPGTISASMPITTCPACHMMASVME